MRQDGSLHEPDGLMLKHTKKADNPVIRVIGFRFIKLF
jgi:hypothetical protein